MFKKNPLDKINGTKTALFFLLRAPTYHSFTFDSQSLYSLIIIENLLINFCKIEILRYVSWPKHLLF